MLLFVNENIPAKLVNIPDILLDIECYFKEINLLKKKWLICSNYNPSKGMIGHHLNLLSRCLEFLSQKYDNIILIGDFNAETNDTEMSQIWGNNQLAIKVWETHPS